MSNEAPQHEAILSSLRSIDFSKPFYLSKTFWVNLLLILSMLFPAVQAWAQKNPEALAIIIAFVNLVLRTATDKAITISGDRVSNDGSASGGSGGILPLALFCLAALCLLPSCAGYPVSASVFHRLDDGAKVGIVYRGK